jgi:hypothetical protein
MSSFGNREESFYMQQSNIETFQSLSQFKSVKDLNNNIESFLSIHKKDFTRGELYCMKTLLRFSVRCFGLSNISINKLLQAVSDKFKKVSEATFHRFKRKAIKLGILAVKTLYRGNGSQSSNLWIWQRYIQNDTPEEVIGEKKSHINPQSLKTEMTSLQTSTPFKTNNHKTIHTPSWINEDFYNAAKPYFDGKTIEELWRISFIHSRINNLQSNHLILASMNSLKVLVRKMKRTFISNPMGYFNGVCSNRMKAVRIKHLWNECWVKD